MSLELPGGKTLKKWVPFETGVGTHREKNRRARGLAREDPGQNAQARQEADPDVVEEWKWMGTPVWSHDGIICTGESYKKVVKLTFARGASLKDPARLFNSSLEGNTRRAIDIHEGEEVDESAFQASFARRSPSTVLASRNVQESEILSKKIAETNPFR